MTKLTHPQLEVTLTGLLLFPLGSVPLLGSEHFWSGWKQATCMPDACFCEAIRGGWMGQPVNVLSSLTFVVVALVVLAAGRHQSQSTQHLRLPLLIKPGLLLTYAAALALVGLGSAFYHASLTFVGQVTDVLGMYLIATFAVLYGLFRRGVITRFPFVVWFVGANIILLALQIAVPVLRRYVFAALILAVLGVEYYVRQHACSQFRTRYIAMAISSLAAGFALWVLDITRTLCWPMSVFQGHALWHVSGALASYYLYKYYASETAKPALLVPEETLR